MKRFSVILLSIVMMYATLGSVLVFAANTTDSTVVIGALDETKPYSTDSTNENKQLLTYCIGQMLGNTKVTYQYYDSYTDMLSDLGAGSIDIAFPVADYDKTAAEFGIDISDDLLESDISLVYIGNYSDSKMETMAVDTNSIVYCYAQAVYPESTKVFCDSQEDCIKAVQEGKASCAVVRDYNCSNVRSMIENDGKLNVTELPYGMLVSFGVKKGDTAMMENINYGIDNISKTDLSARVYAIEAKDDTSVARKFENIGIFGKILIALTAVLVIFGLVYVATVASRRRVVQDRLNKQNQMLREAKLRQDEYNAMAKRREDELRKLEEETESLQLKNDEMLSQTETLENLLVEKYMQLGEVEKSYQMQLEQDMLDRIELMEYEDLELEKMDIRTAIKEILPDIKAMADTVSVDFSLEIDDMLKPYVICDRDKLNNMIIYMLFVAMRSANSGSLVTLSIHRVGEYGGFANFDYVCEFTGDTLDYSSHVTNSLMGVSQIKRKKSGATVITISLRLPTNEELIFGSKN